MIQNLVERLCLIVLFFCVIFWCNKLFPAELRDLTIRYARFHESNRIPDLNGFKAKEGLSVDVNVDLFWRFYWDSRVMSYTDPGSYRMVGLNTKVGFRILDSLSIEAEHFSKHLLDHTDHGYPSGKFPVQDSIGLVWTVYSRD